MIFFLRSHLYLAQPGVTHSPLSSLQAVNATQGAMHRCGDRLCDLCDCDSGTESLL